MDKAKVLSSNVIYDTEQNMLKTLFENARNDDGYIDNRNFEDETADGLDISGCDFENVLFRRCKFSHCNFDGCDFANCNFENSYWKKAGISDSKGDGGNFSGSRFKECVWKDSSFCYANFSRAVFEGTHVRRCKFREAFLSEVKFRLTLFKETDFYRADFFKTPLKGMDMSDCILDGILVSETFRELRGMKGGIEQALSLAGLLGMEIK